MAAEIVGHLSPVKIQLQVRVRVLNIGPDRNADGADSRQISRREAC